MVGTVKNLLALRSFFKYQFWIKSSLGQSVISQKTEKKCGPIIEGLQLCTTTPLISTTLDEQIVVEVSLLNTTQEKIKVAAAGGFTRIYDTTVKAPDGNKLLSRREIAEKKIQDKTATDEDFNYLLPIGNGPLGLEKELESQEELKSIYDLKNFYDFKTKGKYHVEISKKMQKKDKSGNIEIPLGTTIEIEIK